MENLRTRAAEWCREDRSIAWRVPLFLYGFLVAYKAIPGVEIGTPVDFLNLGIHELGHVAFAPLGQWLGVAGGSFAQIMVPLYGIGQFLKQEDFFASAFGFAWLGESLIHLSVYIADARAQQLPLVSPFGGDPIHDWNFLLASMNLLGADARIGGLVRFLGFLSAATFLYLGGWLLLRMARPTN